MPTQSTKSTKIQSHKKAQKVHKFQNTKSIFSCLSQVVLSPHVVGQVTKKCARIRFQKKNVCKRFTKILVAQKKNSNHITKCHDAFTSIKTTSAINQLRSSPSQQTGIQNFTIQKKSRT